MYLMCIIYVKTSHKIAFKFLLKVCNGFKEFSCKERTKLYIFRKEKNV